MITAIITHTHKHRISKCILIILKCILAWIYKYNLYIHIYNYLYIYKHFCIHIYIEIFILNQFSSVTQSCLTLWDPVNLSTPDLPVHHQLPESIQTHVHWVGDVIQPFYRLSFPSPPALNFSQYQGLFKWVSSSHQGVKVLEFQLQHQFFQWTLRTDLL